MNRPLDCTGYPCKYDAQIAWVLAIVSSLTFVTGCLVGNALTDIWYHIMGD